MMVADWNMRGFAHGLAPSMSQRRQVLSFNPETSTIGTLFGGGGVAPSQIQIGGGGYGYVGGNSAALVRTGPPSSNVQIEPVVAGVNLEEGLTSDWSNEEHNILNRGLIKHAAAQGMMKYIKVAAMLPHKTVRDVAMRCQYVARFKNVKRQKLEEQYAGKNRKGKMVESCSQANTNMVPSGNNPSYPPYNQNGQFSSEGTVLDGASQQLMDQNDLILEQIRHNIVTMRIQENIDLLNCVRNNITTVLYNMTQMPGKMGQMPSFQVSLQEDLLNAITCLQNAQLFGTGTHLEQQPKEPRQDNLL